MRYEQYEQYRIYEDGRIYSEKSGKFLKPDVTQGYEQVTLSTEIGPLRVKVHRLVAGAFCPLTIGDSETKDTVNHIDGNKRNNHASNLEWCTDYENNKHARDTGLNNVSKSNSERWKDKEFRAKTSARFSEVRINLGLSKGRHNGRFRYSITDASGKELSRQDVTRITGNSQSFVDTCIREAANGKVIPQFVTHGISVRDTKKSQSTIERRREVN